MGFAVEFLVHGRIVEPKVSGEINHLGPGIQQSFRVLGGDPVR